MVRYYKVLFAEKHIRSRWGTTSLFKKNWGTTIKVMERLERFMNTSFQTVKVTVLLLNVLKYCSFIKFALKIETAPLVYHFFFCISEITVNTHLKGHDPIPESWFRKVVSTFQWFITLAACPHKRNLGLLGESFFTWNFLKSN